MYEKYFDVLKEAGADLALQIDVSKIVIAPWTIYKCKFGCPRYGAYYCCPPNTPTWRDTEGMLKCFNSAILFRCHDFTKLTDIAQAGSRALLLDGYYKVIAYGGSHCTLCEVCGRDHCNHPGRPLPSMEACGIDVFGTVRACGLEPAPFAGSKEDDAGHDYYGLLLVE